MKRKTIVGLEAERDQIDRLRRVTEDSLIKARQELDQVRREKFELVSQRDRLSLDLRHAQGQAAGYQRNWNSATNEIRRLQAQLQQLSMRKRKAKRRTR